MDSPSPNSFNEPTAAQQGAKEYVRLISEYKALASEKDELLRFLLNIARLLDEDENFAERVKSLEDTKASHKRRLAQIEDLQGEITGRMAWLRRQNDNVVKGTDAPEGESAGGSSAAEKDACEKNDGVA